MACTVFYPPGTQRPCRLASFRSAQRKPASSLLPFSKLPPLNERLPFQTEGGEQSPQSTLGVLGDFPKTIVQSALVGLD